jgi:cell division protein ZipA
MWDLRWILLGLGALVVVGVYLWSKGVFRRRIPLPPARGERSEPTIGLAGSEAISVPDLDTTAAPVVEPPLEQPPPPPPKPAVRRMPERIVALRLIPRGEEELPAERAVLALRAVGLKHGRYEIFHRLDARYGDEPMFSVASLTEPGSFDLQNLGDTTIAGLSVFMVLPGEGDPVARFDAMIETARALSVELDSDLRDERGSSWSVQRERYIREELIDYKHQSERR